MTAQRLLRTTLAAVLTAASALAGTASTVAAEPLEIKRFDMYASDPAGVPVATADVVGPFQPHIGVTKGLGSQDTEPFLTPHPFTDPATRISTSTADDDPALMPLQLAPGSHPTLNFRLELPATPDEYLARLKFRLPPGMIGNPQAVPRCPLETFKATSATTGHICPAASQIGYVQLQVGGGRDNPTGRLYNVEPRGDEVARLGAVINSEGSFNSSPGSELDKTLVPVTIGVDTTGDFAIGASQDIPPQVYFKPRENGSTLGISVNIQKLAISVFSHVGGVPFLTNPTSCAPLQTGIEVTGSTPTGADTDGDGLPGPPPLGDTLTATKDFIPDCSGPPVPFTPSMSAVPDDDSAGKPSGYDVGIHFPYDENAAVYQSHLKRVEAQLPEGVALYAPAANQIEACTDAQFGFGNDDAVTCPTDSVIGDIEVASPVVDGDPSTPVRDPLQGKAFFGQPTPNEPWRIFQLIEDAGLRVKLPGHIDIDPDTGQISTVVEDLPPVPFTDFHLKLRGGDNAVLKNPDTCGVHSGSYKLTPFSAGTGTPEVNQPLDVSIGSNCPADPLPFAPQLSAKSDTEQAGASPKSHLEITRPEGDRLVRGLNMSLPRGLLGSLKHVPQCSAGTAAAGTCTPASRVGHVDSIVGTSDSSQISFPGTIHLAEPLQAGDPASLSIVIPAKVGPIDLGVVVVRARLMLRKPDLGVDVVSTEIPKIYGGVPLQLRRVSIDVDRDNFLVNPTGCDTRTFTATFIADGAQSTSMVPFTATGCDKLPFAPKLRLIGGGQGGTAQRAHTPLTAIVTQPEGQSNIASARVVLPDIIKPDTVNINKPGALCQKAQLDAASCPALSQIGSASARSPLLPDSLSGPVFVYQQSVGSLPNLSIQLRGLVGIDLDATNTLGGNKGVQTINTFPSVPDVPQSEFRLNVMGGKSGILINFNDLCSRPARAEATFVGHSGAVFNDRPKLEVEGCRGPRIAVGASSRVKKSRVTLKLTCESTDDPCDGEIALTDKRRKALGRTGFAIAAGETRALKVKLNRRAARALRLSRRLKANTRVTLEDGSASGKVTLRR